MINETQRAAFEAYHAKRAQAIITDVEALHARWVKEGAQDSPATKKEALLYIMSGINESGWDVWQAATAQATAARWMPIETAPKNGDEIDIWSARGRVTGCIYSKPTYSKTIGWVHESDYDSNGPVWELVSGPTHWMPAPPPPAAAGSTAPVEVAK